MSTSPGPILRSDATYNGEPPPTDFALRRDESAGEALRRIVIEQVDLMFWHLLRLGASDDHLHEVRKASKRARAVLRMVGDEVSTESYREFNSTLRDVARHLSEIRSSFVRVETIDDLVEESEPLAEIVTELRRELVVDAARMRAGIRGDSPLGPNLAVRLELLRPKIEAVRIPRHVDPTAGGLRRTYRRGRRDMVRAFEGGSPADLHRWRKQVKYLRHQVEVLAPVHPATMTALAAGLEELGDELGANHDLDDLRYVAVREGNCFASQLHQQEMLDAIARKSVELLTVAYPLAERIYASPPRVFVREVAARWQRWHVEMSP